VSPSPLSLLHLPHRSARAAVATGAPVYLLVNPVEYHGPHLSLHNDQVIARALAGRLHAALAVEHPAWPFLLGDDLEVGVDPCPGPGTRNTPFATACALVVEAVRALAELGTKRIVFMTFHGSPLHAAALEAGVKAARKAGLVAYAPFNHVLEQLSTMQDGEAFADAFETIAEPTRQRLLDKLPYDFHAGFFETSVALALAPETVADDYQSLPPCPETTLDERFLKLARLSGQTFGRGQTFARECRVVAAALGWNALRPFPGYTSEPAHASALVGERFVAHILTMYTSHASRVLAGQERSPAPVLGWTRALSLDGRIEPAPRPGAADVGLA
jgi:creatinine amidohydrolase